MATSYNPYYSGGWQSGEEGGTPITPDALNHMDDGIAGAYAYTQQSTASILLTSSDDIDNVLDTGAYYATTGSMPQNSPTTLNYGLHVNRRNDLPVQVIVDNNSRMMYRVKYSSGWQGWRLVTTTVLS